MPKPGITALDFVGVAHDLRPGSGFSSPALGFLFRHQAANLAFLFLAELAGIASLFTGAGQNGLHLFHQAAGLDGFEHVFSATSASTSAQVAVAAAIGRATAITPRDI